MKAWDAASKGSGSREFHLLALQAAPSRPEVAFAPSFCYEAMSKGRGKCIRLEVKGQPKVLTTQKEDFSCMNDGGCLWQGRDINEQLRE